MFVNHPHLLITVAACLQYVCVARVLLGSLRSQNGVPRTDFGNRTVPLPVAYCRDPALDNWYGHQLRDIFGSALPEHDVRQVLPRFQTCAVVSNSGRMALHEHGAAIDSHDAVIRFNSAPTRGFEKYVGGKTTIRVFNSQLMFGHEDGSPPDVPLDSNSTLLVMRDLHVKNNLSDWVEKAKFRPVQSYIARRLKNPQERFFIMSSLFNHHVVQALNQTSPSTGFFGVILALQLCDLVDVYEIAPSKKENHRRYYWERPSQAVDHFCPHACESERAFLLKHSDLGVEATKSRGLLRISPASHRQLLF